MSRVNHWRRAASTILAAVAILAAGASPALAASPQTVLVLGVVTVTGVPASVDFGSGGPGDAKVAAFDVVVATNNPTGYNLRAQNGSLIKGPDQIAKTAQTWNGTAGAGCNASCVDAPAGAQPSGAGTYVVLGSYDGSTAGQTWAVTDSLTIPNVPPGSYVGDDGNGQGFTVFAVTQ